MPFLSIIAYYKIEKSEIEKLYQQQLSNGLNKSDLVKLEFTKVQTETKLSWLSKREFKLENIIYKVIDVEYHGDKIIYLCWKNSDNTMLTNNIADFIAKAMGSDSQNQKTANNFVSFLKSLFASESFVWNPNLLNHEISEQFVFYSRLLSNYLECPKPPPKISIID